MGADFGLGRGVGGFILAVHPISRERLPAFRPARTATGRSVACLPRPAFSMLPRCDGSDFWVTVWMSSSPPSRAFGPAPAGKGQARRAALRLARESHGIQLLQRTLRQSVRSA